MKACSPQAHDPEADALYVRIGPKSTPVVGTREIEPGIIFDVDAYGDVIGIEVLHLHARGRVPPRMP